MATIFLTNRRKMGVIKIKTFYIGNIKIVIRPYKAFGDLEIFPPRIIIIKKGITFVLFGISLTISKKENGY